MIVFQLGTIVSYVLGPVVVLKGEEITDDGTNWSYYLMGQALLAYVVFLITVIGKRNVQCTFTNSTELSTETYL